MARRKRKAPGSVYLVHFSRKLSHARHYMGHAKNIAARFDLHKRGRGARILAAAAAAGINFRIVRKWLNGSRDFERKLKNTKNHSQLCPVCSGPAAMRRGRQ